MDKPYITNPVHGGKVTCHKCNGFIVAGDGIKYPEKNLRDDVTMLDYDVWFHVDCYNRYEHYYGLDKPID